MAGKSREEGREETVQKICKNSQTIRELLCTDQLNELYMYNNYKGEKSLANLYR